MLKKALIALLLLGMSVALACYVYPTHPGLVWSLLGVCGICSLLGLRAQKLFHQKRTSPEQPEVSRSPL